MRLFKLSFLVILTVLGAFSCTDRFDEINKNPQSITADEASAKFFLTTTQAKLYGPGRFEYWRAQLIHADRYSGQFTFGHSGSWWSDGLAYDYNSGYTDATWDWLEGYFGGLDNFLKLTEADGIFENEKMNAVGLIMKGLYFQLFTDTFGEIPYSDIGVEGILLPKYDEQKDIYSGIIDELDEAMSIIGTATNTSEIPGDINDLGANDLIFGGNLEMWKKLANSLKLRIAMRAKGASGNDFSATAITEALANPLLESGENALLEKDLAIDQFGSGAYGDIWHNFGGGGSKWSVSEVIIHYLRDYGTDPRLPLYALPADGGKFTFPKGDDIPGFTKRINRIRESLDGAALASGVDYSYTDNGEEVTIVVPLNTYYSGQPVRLGSEIKSMARREFFSFPGDLVLEPKNAGTQFPEIVMTAAEVYFLRAEAALNGSGEDAQAMFQMGIAEAMNLWGVDGTNYIETSSLADISSGTLDEKFEKIAIQKWLAAYTDGFEAWSVVRKSGYPSELANGVSDIDIYSLGTIDGDYPQRLRYGNAASNLNGTNLGVAIGRQGADAQNTILWWAND